MDNSKLVYIIDDDKFVREGIEALLKTVNLNSQSFSNCNDFLDSFSPDQNSCLLLDIRMPGMSGLMLQQHLRQKNIKIPIIVITGHADVSIAVTALQNGAFDFIEKPFNDQRLIESITKALQLDAVTKEKQNLVNKYQKKIEKLSKREIQVMDMLTEGKCNKQVAAELEISYKTADYHRQKLLRKMNVQGIVELTKQKMEAEQFTNS